MSEPLPILGPEAVKQAIEVRYKLLGALEICQGVTLPKLQFNLRRLTPASLLPVDRLNSYLCDLQAKIATAKSKSAPKALLDFWEAIAFSILAHEIDGLLSIEDRAVWQKALLPLWANTAKGIFELLSTQCRELISGVVDAVAEVVSGEGKGVVLLPNLPLGNSIPVIVAEEAYRQLDWTPICPVWNPPRHEKYRAAAFKRFLSEYRPDSITALHYIDEWESGTNLLGISKCILNAGWPADKLTVTAIGNQGNLTLRPEDKNRKALETMTFASKRKPRFVELTQNPLQSAESQARRIFYSDLSRLIGFRKMNSANQLASKMVDLAIKLSANVPDAVEKFSQWPGRNQAGESISDDDVREGLARRHPSNLSQS